MRECKNWKTCIVIAVAGMAFSQGIALAQADESETGEVVGYAGGAFGLGSHALVGGSTGVAFSRYAMGLVDISYIPFGTNTLHVRRAGEIAQHSGLYDFNVSFHVRVPVTPRWAPYGILGAGLMYNTFDLAMVTGAGAAAVHSHSETAFGFHTGGGLRYYVREHWGIRPEVKVVVSSRTYLCASVGVFYVLPAGWP